MRMVVTCPSPTWPTETKIRKPGHLTRGRKRNPNATTTRTMMKRAPIPVIPNRSALSRRPIIPARTRTPTSRIRPQLLFSSRSVPFRRELQDNSLVPGHKATTWIVEDAEGDDGAQKFLVASRAPNLDTLVVTAHEGDDLFLYYLTQSLRRIHASPSRLQAGGWFASLSKVHIHHCLADTDYNEVAMLYVQDWAPLLTLPNSQSSGYAVEMGTTRRRLTNGNLSLVRPPLSI